MSYDLSATFDFSNGRIQIWEKPINVTKVYFTAYGGGGGGGGGNASGGGGAYVFSSYVTLTNDISFNVYICIGSGGQAGRSGSYVSGGISAGGKGDFTNGGKGSYLENLYSGGGGGLTSIYYNVSSNEIIKIIAGGGGGAGNNSSANGGNSGEITTEINKNNGGGTGFGTGGGQGGNIQSNGKGGLGGTNGSVNGYDYIVDLSNNRYFYDGGGGGEGGTFAGGGGGAGYGGGAGGKNGGGGGGGSYSNADNFAVFNTCLIGAGQGGAPGQPGSNGKVVIQWFTGVSSTIPVLPVYMMNAFHTGRSIFTSPANIIDASSAISTTTTNKTTPYQIVLSSINNLYILSGDGTFNGFNYKLTPKSWNNSPTSVKYNLSPEDLSLYGLDTNPLKYTPAIDNKGTIYIGSSISKLYAFNDTNNYVIPKWVFDVSGLVSCSPTIDENDNIYIGTDNGSLYSIKDGGNTTIVNWKYVDPTPAPNAINSTPAINIIIKKLAYTTATTISLIDFSQNIYPNPPNNLWTKILDLGSNVITSSPSMDSLGTSVYVSTSDISTANGYVHAYYVADGTSIWNDPDPVHIYDSSLSAISININNKYIYLTSSNAFYSIDALDGKIVWKFPFYNSDNIQQYVPLTNTNCLIDKNNTILFGANQYVYALDPSNHLLKWRSKALNGTISAMPIIDSDSSELVNNEVISKIFVTTNNGTVYDFSGTSTLPYQEQPLPMVMINPQHQGVSRYRGPLSTSTSIRNVWQQPAPFVSSNLYVLPSISIKSIESNNLLYLASNDGKLYTIADTYNNPSILNILSLSSLEIYTTPLIGYDGTIYVGSRDGYLYAVNPFPLFTKKWQYYVGGFLQSSPIMDASGIIYFASGTNMYAIGDGGAYGAYLKWLNPYSTGGNIKSSPALGMNGYLYFGSDDGYIYAIDSVTGLEQYKIKPSNTPTLPARSGDTDPFPGDPGYPAADIHPVYTSATVDISNNVIIGNGSWMQGILYYLDGSDLSTKWSCSFDNETGPFYNTVAVKGDVIYLSTIAYVYAINRVNGSLNWTYNGNFIYYSSPMVDASGYIYVSAIINDNIETTEAASIISLKDMGTSYVENWVLKVSDGPLMKGRLAPPVIGPNNRIYVSSTDNRIYAIGDPLYIV